MTHNRSSPIVGVVLAGGRSSRMGGADKCLLPLAGRPLLDHVIARLRPQVDTVVINANGDPARFAGFGLPVVADPPNRRYSGPLAGILAGMRWASGNGDAAVIATAPSDTPFLPADLVERLADAGSETQIAVARADGRLHPVIGLFPVRYADTLEQFMITGSSLRVDAWLARHDIRVVDFGGTPAGGLSLFFNINTRADLEEADAVLATSKS